MRRFAVTSLSPAQADPARLLALGCAHWSIEHGLHYPRNVWFGEDASQVWAGFIPEVMAIFRNMLLLLFHAWGYPCLKFAREHFTLHPFQALGLLELPVPVSLK